MFSVTSGISTVVILSTQIALTELTSVSFLIALVCSTTAGFIVRYLLDVTVTNQSTIRTDIQEVVRASTYLMTSVVATAVYWSVAYAAHYNDVSPGTQTFASLAGLVVGNIVKYKLDDHLTFRTDQYSRSR